MAGNDGNRDPFPNDFTSAEDIAAMQRLFDQDDEDDEMPGLINETNIISDTKKTPKRVRAEVSSGIEEARTTKKLRTHGYKSPESYCKTLESPTVLSPVSSSQDPSIIPSLSLQSCLSSPEDDSPTNPPRNPLMITFPTSTRRSSRAGYTPPTNSLGYDREARLSDPSIDPFCPRRESYYDQDTSPQGPSFRPQNNSPLDNPRHDSDATILPPSHHGYHSGPRAGFRPELPYKQDNKVSLPPLVHDNSKYNSFLSDCLDPFAVDSQSPPYLTPTKKKQCTDKSDNAWFFSTPKNPPRHAGPSTPPPHHNSPYTPPRKSEVDEGVSDLINPDRTPRASRLNTRPEEDPESDSELSKEEKYKKIICGMLDIKYKFFKNISLSMLRSYARVFNNRHKGVAWKTPTGVIDNDNGDIFISSLTVIRCNYQGQTVARLGHFVTFSKEWERIARARKDPRSFDDIEDTGEEGNGMHFRGYFFSPLMTEEGQKALGVIDNPFGKFEGYP